MLSRPACHSACCHCNKTDKKVSVVSEALAYGLLALLCLVLWLQRISQWEHEADAVHFMVPGKQRESQEGTKCPESPLKA